MISNIEVGCRAGYKSGGCQAVSAHLKSRRCQLGSIVYIRDGPADHISHIYNVFVHPIPPSLFYLVQRESFTWPLQPFKNTRLFNPFTALCFYLSLLQHDIDTFQFLFDWLFLTYGEQSWFYYSRFAQCWVQTFMYFIEMWGGGVSVP